MSPTSKASQDIKERLDKLSVDLHWTENMFDVLSELRIHYGGKGVNPEYRKAMIWYDSYFTSVRRALLSTMITDIHAIVSSSDQRSLQALLRELKKVDGAPDLTADLDKLRVKFKDDLAYMKEARRKIFAHKSKVDLNSISEASHKTISEILLESRRILNSAREIFGVKGYEYSEFSSAAAKQTHSLLNQLLVKSTNEERKAIHGISEGYNNYRVEDF